MSKMAKRAFKVEIVLLRMYLTVVVSLAVGVLTLPEYSRRSPPTVSWVAAMGLSFLGSNGGDDVSIGDFSIGGNLFSVDEEDGIGSFGDVSANSLGKTAKLVGERLFPDSFVWSFDKMVIKLNLARRGICD